MHGLVGFELSRNHYSSHDQAEGLFSKICSALPGEEAKEDVVCGQKKFGYEDLYVLSSRCKNFLGRIVYALRYESSHLDVLISRFIRLSYFLPPRNRDILYFSLLRCMLISGNSDNFGLVYSSISSFGDDGEYIIEIEALRGNINAAKKLYNKACDQENQYKLTPRQRERYLLIAGSSLDASLPLSERIHMWETIANLGPSLALSDMHSPEAIDGFLASNEMRARAWIRPTLLRLENGDFISALLYLENHRSTILRSHLLYSSQVNIHKNDRENHLNGSQDAEKRQTINRKTYQIEIKNVKNGLNSSKNQKYHSYPQFYEDIIASGKTSWIHQPTAIDPVKESSLSPNNPEVLFIYYIVNGLDCNVIFVSFYGNRYCKWTLPPDVNRLVEQSFLFFSRKSTSSILQNSFFSRLFDVFLGPIDDHEWWKLHKNLIIIPHGILHNIPFGALMFYNGDKRGCTVLPAGYCAEHLAPCSWPHNLAILPDPTGMLPHAQKECEDIVDEYENAKILHPNHNDDDYTLLASSLENYDGLHVCCHMEYEPQRPLTSGFIMSRSGRKLSVSDLYHHKLRAPHLIVMAGCEGCRQQTWGAAEELQGLASLWLGCGSRAVIGSLWPVDDMSCRLFSKSFYQQRKAQKSHADACPWTAFLAAVDSVRQRYPDPFHWGGYIYIGLPSKVF